MASKAQKEPIGAELLLIGVGFLSLMFGILIFCFLPKVLWIKVLVSAPSSLYGLGIITYAIREIHRLRKPKVVNASPIDGVTLDGISWSVVNDRGEKLTGTDYICTQCGAVYPEGENVRTVEGVVCCSNEECRGYPGIFQIAHEDSSEVTHYIVAIFPDGRSDVVYLYRVETSDPKKIADQFIRMSLPIYCEVYGKCTEIRVHKKNKKRFGEDRWNRMPILIQKLASEKIYPI